MQEATFLILTSLAEGSQHGYGIINDVTEISGGRVRLRAGTLYTALDRLRVDGLVEVDGEEVVEGRLRRYYRLTPDGTKLLAVLGGGHEYGEDLFFILLAERARVKGQQPPVPALQARGAVHVTTPRGLSRRIAAVALACSRAASAASSLVPSGVSR